MSAELVYTDRAVYHDFDDNRERPLLEIIGADLHYDNSGGEYSCTPIPLDKVRELLDRAAPVERSEDPTGRGFTMSARGVRVWDVSTTGQLAELAGMYVKDAPLLCQVVAEDGTTWNVFLQVSHGADCGFKWERMPLILTLSHPDLMTLPRAAQRSEQHAPQSVAVPGPTHGSEGGS